MRVSHLLFGAAAALSLAASPAAAQSADRVIDGWLLTDDGESCALSMESEDGHAMTMINDGAGNADGLAFIHDGLSGATMDQTETVQYSINGAPWKDFTAMGIELSTGTQGYHLIRFPIAMFSAAPQQGDFRIRRNGTVLHSFPLANLQRAAKEMASCALKY